MDIYAENILDHFRNPRNRGELAAGATVEHKESNVECGDDLHVFLTIDNKKITDIKWGGQGCAISQAGMSILSEEITGMSEDDVLAMTKDDVYKMLGVPIGPRRFKCALMSLHVTKNAILKSQGRDLQSWVETVE